jgi:hypothetical protein
MPKAGLPPDRRAWARHQGNPRLNPARRFTVFFAVIFVVTAALDVWTTELGRQRPNTVELNPLGFMPLKQSVLLEIPLLLIGAGSVALGAWWRRTTLMKAGDVTFGDFLKELWFGGNYLGALLLFAPIAVSLLRFTAITNNAMQLLWGWSVWGRYLIDPLADWTGWPLTKAYLVACSLFAFAALVPVTWVIQRVAAWKST